MNYIKKALTTLGGIFLAAFLIAALAPKATHAIVAALVQVVNTTANPVVNLSADTSTRVPYQSTQTFSWTQTSVYGSQLITFAQVPAGYRLVTENVSAYLYINSGNPTPNGNICTQFNQTTCFPFFSGIYTGSDGFSGIINQQVTRYVGPGDTPLLAIEAAYSVTNPGFPNTVTLTGHLESCVVVGCPAIVE
jgi:hypothetical protein